MSVVPLDRGGREGSGRADPDTLDSLRRKMAVMSGMPDRRSVQPGPAEVFALPDAIADLLPRSGIGKDGSSGQHGIARGTVVGYRGARSLLMAMIATLTQAGHQVGIVGMPRLNLLAAVEMGADLRRIAVVPDPGIDPVEVAAVLLDGMDVVVVGLRGTTVAPSRSRVVGGRARQQGSSLVVVDGDWPGAHTRMDARVIGYRHGPEAADLAGAHRGYGRVGGMRLQIVVGGRDHRRRSAEIDITAGGFGDDAVHIRRVGPSVSVAADAPGAVAN
ncbi:hypothetical protein GPOL_c16210 [Gordonia polyisoprenivorans VH2]|uniref:Uncharacterized protein n=2 Tax=Gordonia polyisoprenivorans TaxID=84595 RepID=H6MTI6_GORPV|nr:MULTISPECIES: hypothetical protein [Gordonia]AFA72670.1 hypothetical protein GPOL_c16210 [Gordonia polyisoprenivorans VH2]NKY01240.1 hypothetical protein [Gordonia polyisoprenivorans]OPX16175.1 hypothetical protein B1964_06150 [Gordonia sp. i37]OZC29788.1 hypothetical protein CJJ17_24245 [Gordonia polyisoprenivorans]QUD81262.1 hypothetical protein J8M97_15755 [Gordonia polyisoprenivorans]